MGVSVTYSPEVQAHPGHKERVVHSLPTEISLSLFSLSLSLSLTHTHTHTRTHTHTHTHTHTSTHTNTHKHTHTSTHAHSLTLSLSLNLSLSLSLSGKHIRKQTVRISVSSSKTVWIPLFESIGFVTISASPVSGCMTGWLCVLCLS